MKLHCRNPIVILTAILVGCFAWIPAPALAASPKEQVAAMASAYDKSGVVGVSVIDLRSGSALYELHADEPRTPASNQKLVTCAFAIAKLGSDFEFVTAVYRLGDDVIVVGDGDPTLGDPVLAQANGTSIYAELDKWAGAVKASFGDQPVRNVVLCVSRDPARYRHEDWPDNQLDRWYAAPAADLNFNNNCIDIELRVSGGKIQATVHPVSRLIQVDNRLQLGKKGDPWSARPAKDLSTVALLGKTSGPTGEPQSVAIDDPPMLLGRALVERLLSAGVNIGGSLHLTRASDVDLKAANRISETRTPLMVAIMRANKRSLNMAAECIFLRAGDGTWEGSAAIASQTLCKAYGLVPANLDIREGSGLSAKDRVAPSAMTAMLKALAGNKAFVESLPIAGEDGTLERRMKDPASKGHVLGKTGYIAGASCLSGYVLDKSGKPAYAYSIMCNKAADLSKARALQDNVCKTLAQAAD